MTPEFLELLQRKFPNNYELGEIVRKYYFFYKENEPKMFSYEIEHLFIKTIFNEPISFQKAQ